MSLLPLWTIALLHYATEERQANVWYVTRERLARVHPWIPCCLGNRLGLPWLLFLSELSSKLAQSSASFACLSCALS